MRIGQTVNAALAPSTEVRVVAGLLLVLIGLRVRRATGA